MMTRYSQMIQKVDSQDFLSEISNTISNVSKRINFQIDKGVPIHKNSVYDDGSKMNLGLFLMSRGRSQAQ